MKKILLVGLVFLLIVACVNIHIVPVSSVSERDLWVTPGLPEEVRESSPTNETVEEYLNTTNPHADTIGLLGASSEVDVTEGISPLYVLVFGDEEERERIRLLGTLLFFWDMWAEKQLERADEALVANFGIDIRILDFLEWDSDDSIDSFYDRWYELEADTKSYLGHWYDGKYWDNQVDAIIGITSQATTENVAGGAPSPTYIDQGKIFILLRWQIHWADDNLAQHEVSHLFCAPDHYATCCAMADHSHFVLWIWENGLWLVLADVDCSYTSYHWCTSCTGTINSHLNRYHPDPILGDVVVSTNKLWLLALCIAIPVIPMVVLVLVKRCKKLKNRKS